MNIIVFGAAGDVGQRIANEAVRRGHRVTGVVRNEAQFARLPGGVVVLAADASSPTEVASAAADQDLVISALRPPAGRENELATLTESVLAGAGSTGLRALFVGGAGRLRIPWRNGDTVLTAPDFLPESAVAIARACQMQYELFLTTEEKQWTYLSPAAMLQPGERTGHYRLGTDTLVVDESGISRISMEDFAVAMLDEAESPKHIERAFTVGY